MQVPVHEAKTNLSKLIDAVLGGEKVVITKGGRPVARLVPFVTGRFRIGGLENELGGTAPDFLEPMSEEDLTLWEGGSQ